MEDLWNKICSLLPSPVDEDIPDDDKEAAYEKGYMDAIEDAANLVRKHGEWIKVSERLPEKPYGCLVRCNTGYISLGYYHENCWEARETIKNFAERGYEVTHWMPLPEPPKEA